MTAGLQADSMKIVESLFHKYDVDKGELRIECNWCCDNDYIFYEGRSGYSMYMDDWLAAAVVHLTTYHSDRLEP